MPAAASHRCLQDKSPGSEKRRSSEPAAEQPAPVAAPAVKAEAPAPAATAAAAAAPTQQQRKAAEKEKKAAAEREKKLGPRLFDRAVAAAVRDKRSGEPEEPAHRSSKRSRK